MRSSDGTLAQYYALTKPGIIKGNVMTAAAGFLFASLHGFDVWLFLATLAGTALVIASGCVVNNYIDRGIDSKMKRTKKRALVSGKITARRALIFASVLGLAGLLLIAFHVNILVLVIALIAWIDYVVLYGIAKRKTVHGTLVGSISGAASLTAGYCAVTGEFDMAALLLFLIMTFWQMPHFYAIAIFRGNDYAAAGIPVLPLARSVRATKIQIMAYTAAFALAVAALTFLGYTGYVFLAIMTVLNGVWLYRGYIGFNTQDDVKWARMMFIFSLNVLLVLSVMLAIGARLP